MELHIEGATAAPEGYAGESDNNQQLFYTLSSFYIIFLMTSVYARTREREKAWKFGLYCLVGSMVVAPIWYLIFWKWIYPIRISPLKKVRMGTSPCLYASSNC
jgi:hypothetical protein